MQNKVPATLYIHSLTHEQRTLFGWIFYQNDDHPITQGNGFIGNGKHDTDVALFHSLGLALTHCALEIDPNFVNLTIKTECFYFIEWFKGLTEIPDSMKSLYDEVDAVLVAFEHQWRFITESRNEAVNVALETLEETCKPTTLSPYKADSGE